MLGELASIVVPIYLCAALGYGWVRIGRRYDTALITELITFVGAPCLVFSRLVRLEVDPVELAHMVGATAAALTTLGIVGAIALRLAGLPTTSFLAPIMFGNTGNIGLPVCLFAFGDEGLALAVCFFATTTIVHFTVGQWVWSGSVSAGLLARTPLAYASVIAAAVLAFELPVPQWLERTTSLLGSFTIPLMQFTLGVSLAELHASHIPRSLALSVFRIGLGLAVGLSLAALLDLTGVARGVFILQCAMPVAVFNYLMAQRHGRTPGDVASVVVLSTLVSFGVLPLLLAWLL